MPPRQRIISRQPDKEASRAVVARVALGIIIGVVLGAVIGLLIAIIPIIPWWGGVIVGIFTGVTAAGIIGGELGVDRVQYHAYDRR